MFEAALEMVRTHRLDVIGAVGSAKVVASAIVLTRQLPSSMPSCVPA